MGTPDDWQNPITAPPGQIQTGVDLKLLRPSRTDFKVNCPSAIADVLTGILTTGLLRIRALGSSGNAQRCALESDHLHNVPDLLVHYSPERLTYYWEIERPAYINQTPHDELVVWEPLWRQLSGHVKALACSNALPDL